MPGDANIVLELPDVTNRSPQNSNRSLSSREFSSDSTYTQIHTPYLLRNRRGDVLI